MSEQELKWQKIRRARTPEKRDILDWEGVKTKTNALHRFRDAGKGQKMKWIDYIFDTFKQANYRKFLQKKEVNFKGKLYLPIKCTLKKRRIYLIKYWTVDRPCLLVAGHCCTCQNLSTLEMSLVSGDPEQPKTIDHLSNTPSLRFLEEKRGW